MFPVESPPLRARREDVALIAVHLVNDVCRRMHRPPLALGPSELAALESYEWPGNVRELRNVLERAVISTPHVATHMTLPPLGARSAPPAAPPVESGRHPPLPDADTERVISEAEMRRREKENLVAALKAAGGRVYGEGGAAGLLGIKPTTLASRLKKLGIGRRE